MTKLINILCGVLSLIFYCFNSAVSQDIITATKLTSPIQFDGKVSLDEWAQVDPLPLVMQIPNFGLEPTEHSEIRMAYDQDYIYLSGLLLMEDSDKIMGNSLKRDALVGATDFFGLVIDSYNDKENALAFFTTPTGLRWDGAIFNDANGELPINLSWNNFWDVKTTQDENGWYVEMRVPFSSLQFQTENDKVVMGITAWRYISTKNETSIYPEIPPDFGDWSAMKPSVFQEFEFEGIEPKKPFYITPYFLSGFESINLLNDPETAYDHEEDFVRELGVDIKYGLSNNWTMDLSYNTDFAQVEVDDQQVNLTRFSLFFPEKRLFFQERSGIFDYTFGRSDKLFYSRKIGIDEDGNPIPIHGGARIVGRSGDWDLGFLSMQTHSSKDLNSENNSVLRMSRKIFNQNSDAGLIVTNKMDSEGNFSTSYGVDASVRVIKDNYLRLRWAQTFSDSLDNKFVSFDPSRWWISMSNQSQRGMTYGASVSYSGKDFDPALGFIVRDNYFRIGTRLQYNWFLNEDSPIFRHGILSRGAVHWSNEDHKMESLNWGFGWEIQSKSGWKAEITFKPTFENLKEEFELSDDAIIPIGEYEFYSYELQMVTPFSNPFVLIGTSEYGGFYDGNKTSFSLTPMYNVSSHLELSASYEYNNIQFSDRDESFIVHVGRIKALYMFSTKVTLATFIQYNNVQNSLVGNLRLRYNPSEGNDLYIVLNGDRNYDLLRETPNLPEFNKRSVLVKYSYTFRK